MSRKFRRSGGKHQYSGKMVGRGSRLLSKIHRGIKGSDTIAETFKKIGETNGKEI